MPCQTSPPSQLSPIYCFCVHITSGLPQWLRNKESSLLNFPFVVLGCGGGGVVLNYSWSCQGFHDEHYGCSLVMEDTAWSVKVRNFQELQIMRWMMRCDPELYDPSLSHSWSPAIRILPFPLEAICGETLISCSISAPKKCSSGWVSSIDNLRKEEEDGCCFLFENGNPEVSEVPGFWGQFVVIGPWWIYGVSSVLEQISESGPVWEGSAGGPILCVGLLPLSLLPPSAHSLPLFRITQPLFWTYSTVRTRARLSDSYTVLLWTEWLFFLKNQVPLLLTPSKLSVTNSGLKGETPGPFQEPSYPPNFPIWTFAQAILLPGRFLLLAFTF